MNTRTLAASLAGGVPAITLAGLLAIAALAGCAQVPQTAVACAVDEAGKIVPVATAPDPAALKVINVALTAGAELAADPACQDAVKAALARLQNPVPKP